ncbi:hypothetical protein [Streptomyces sp. GESEQ-35]|uniref:hypothetical protein n=1 Tax=Streptomyces sp. GESEQ-35 TaxID=2812657 RepID=UPI001FF43A75|nr:hypothetical protein [Streptomyces sp. GESEQ-35]
MISIDSGAGLANATRQARCTECPSPAITRMARIAFWRAHLPEQLGGPAVDGQLGFQFRDPLAGRGEFGLLPRGALNILW